MGRRSPRAPSHTTETDSGTNGLRPGNTTLPYPQSTSTPAVKKSRGKPPRPALRKLRRARILLPHAPEAEQLFRTLPEQLLRAIKRTTPGGTGAQRMKRRPRKKPPRSTAAKGTQ